MLIAQTNLQLYNQLFAQPSTANDLGDVRAAYELAAELFSGLYRCSGKPFVAHVVGTASVVATVDGRRDLLSPAPVHRLRAQSPREPAHHGLRVPEHDRRGVRIAPIDQNLHLRLLAQRLKDEGHAAATLCLVTPKDDGLANRDRYLDCLKMAAAALSHAPKRG